MPLIWGAAISAGAGLAGGVLTRNSAKQNAREANEASAEMSEAQRAWATQEASTARDFNARQAAGTRDWQQWMSGTAHQREVQDLRAAGLNPILSASGGMGSSTPSGATASASAPSGSAGSAQKADTIDVVGPAISSAMNVVSKLAEAVNKQADTQNKVADTSLKGAQEENVRLGTEKTSAEILTEMERPKLIKAQVVDYIERAALTQATRSKIPLERDKLATEISELGSRMVLQAKQGVLAGSSAAKLDEETRALEITKFVRKQVMQLEKSDLPAFLHDTPLDLVKGSLLHLLRGKAD